MQHVNLLLSRCSVDNRYFIFKILFTETLEEVGKCIKDDIKLGSIFVFLVLFTPENNSAEKEVLLFIVKNSEPIDRFYLLIAMRFIVINSSFVIIQL